MPIYIESRQETRYLRGGAFGGEKRGLTAEKAGEGR